MEQFCDFASQKIYKRGGALALDAPIRGKIWPDFEQILHEAY